MPELSLYQTEQDELGLVEEALGKRCELIPDLNYPTAEFISLTALEEYKLYRAQTRAFYFLSEEFTRYPLEMRRIQKNGKTVHFIGSDGGPSIYFLGGGLFEENGSNFVRPGAISYRPTYWVGRKTEKVSPELIKTYNFLVKSVKKSSIRIKPGIRVYWLGQDAKRAVQAGAKVVGYEKLSARQLLE